MGGVPGTEAHMLSRMVICNNTAYHQVLLKGPWEEPWEERPECCLSTEQR